MIKVTVCVGSSCHLRGSYKIIKVFERIIRDKGLSDQIDFQGSFCMEHCTEAANIKINDEIYSVRALDEAEALFAEKVLAPLGVNAE
jgi:NADH:ubiquinone oxidoreductase subunit E